MTPHIIVLGNEKGGTGKSTLSVHLIVSLLKLGHPVGSIDLDARQGSLTRYITNRRAYKDKHPQVDIPLCTHFSVHRSEAPTKAEAEEEEKAKFTEALNQLANCEFIVIDTPGNDNHLSRLAHSYADTLITPLNDSFVDLDLLVRIEDEKLIPSTYAEMVWDQKKIRAQRGSKPMEWIVVRNRMANIHAKNKEEVERVLSLLAKRIGFKLAAGFSERVIFRELFLTGLTLLDMHKVDMKMSLSHIAAREELRQLITMVNLSSSAKQYASAV